MLCCVKSCPALCDPMNCSLPGLLLLLLLLLCPLGFSKQEYWSGLPFPSPGDLPFLHQPHLPVLQVLHGHKQTARDVEELPAQTIWGANTGDSHGQVAGGQKSTCLHRVPPPRTAASQTLGRSGPWGPS